MINESGLPSRSREVVLLNGWRLGGFSPGDSRKIEFFDACSCETRWSIWLRDWPHNVWSWKNTAIFDIDGILFAYEADSSEPAWVLNLSDVVYDVYDPAKLNQSQLLLRLELLISRDMIYIESQGFLFAVNPLDGHVQWYIGYGDDLALLSQTALSKYCYYGTSVMKHDARLVVSSAMHVIAMDLESSEYLWHIESDSFPHTPLPVICDGSIVLSCGPDMRLQAIGDCSLKLRQAFPRDVGVVRLVDCLNSPEDRFRRQAALKLILQYPDKAVGIILKADSVRIREYLWLAEKGTYRDYKFAVKYHNRFPELDILVPFYAKVRHQVTDIIRDVKSDKSVRRFATLMHVRSGGAGKGELVVCLGDRDPQVRIYALWGLRQLLRRRETRAGVNEIIEQAFADVDASVRAYAIRSVTVYDDGERDRIVGRLKELLKTERQRDVIREAERLLRRMTEAEAGENAVSEGLPVSQ
ncbi:MAG: PQQ-like beta-propeller repeat protein [Armatimonadetes bacterium]|nr:PQQ-like beta-propeller repeat protein [Armatimonadota bacterium]